MDAAEAGQGYSTAAAREAQARPSKKERKAGAKSDNAEKKRVDKGGAE